MPIRWWHGAFVVRTLRVDAAIATGNGVRSCPNQVCTHFISPISTLQTACHRMNFMDTTDEHTWMTVQTNTIPLMSDSVPHMHYPKPRTKCLV